MNAEERPVRFTCGPDWLYGVLSAPQQARQRGVLILVGGGQYRAGSHRQFVLLARHLASFGIPVMRFDFRGMGDSEGQRREFDQVDDQVRAAIDHFFQSVPGMKEVALWGLCDAASAALLYAAGDQRVTGLALLNPWVRTEAGMAKAYLKHYYLARLFDPDLWKKIRQGRFDFRGAARSFLNMAHTALSKDKQPVKPTGNQVAAPPKSPTPPSVPSKSSLGVSHGPAPGESLAALPETSHGSSLASSLESTHESSHGSSSRASPESSAGSSLKPPLDLSPESSHGTSHASSLEPSHGSSFEPSPDRRSPSLPDRMRDGYQRFKGRVLLILSGDDLTAQEFSDLVASDRSWRSLLKAPRTRRLELPGANHTFATQDWRNRVESWTREWIESW